MKHAHYVLLSVLLCLSVTSARAQEATLSAPEASAAFARNSVFLELGGNGLLYTFNYDRLFSKHVSGRVGAMVVSGTSEGNFEGDHFAGTGVLLPVTVNYLIGSGTSRLELGAGPLIGGGDFVTRNGRTYGLGFRGITSTIAYRRQPTDGGFNFRIGLTPFYARNTSLTQLWGGLSFGYTF